jgi:hypothetical protein
VENPPLPADPPIDCFYVYPTVSEQRSRNADEEPPCAQRGRCSRSDATPRQRRRAG